MTNSEQLTYVKPYHQFKIFKPNLEVAKSSKLIKLLNFFTSEEFTM